MKTVKLSELENLIKEYSNQDSFTKPLMLWFANNRTLDLVKGDLTSDTRKTIAIMGHPMEGHKKIVVGDSVEEISHHPEILTNDVPPLGLTKDTSRIVYHTYIHQLKRNNLDYCSRQVQNLQLPIICLINDYEAAKEYSFDTDYLASKFEQYFVLERTVDEWIEWASQTYIQKNQQGKEFVKTNIVPELVEYVRNHKDLFVESPALEGMPHEAMHTRETQLNSISYKMEDERRNPNIAEAIKLLHLEDLHYPFQFTQREDFLLMLKNYFN